MNMFCTDIKPMYIEVAKQIMENIQNDCGVANRFDGGFKYPKYWVELIAKYSQPLFENHPKILTDEFLDDISFGGEELRGKLRNKYPEFGNLDSMLEKYSKSL